MRGVINIAKYANQTTIIIDKCPKDPRNEKALNGKELSIIVNQAQFNNAINIFRQEGGLGAMALWSYLMSNNHNFKLDFSPQHLSNVCGYSKGTISKSIEKLKELGYLVEKDGTLYCYGWPQQKEVPKDFSDLKFEELIKMSQKDMKDLYNKIQNEMDWDSLSEDLEKFYIFYQQFYAGD